MAVSAVVALARAIICHVRGRNVLLVTNDDSPRLSSAVTSVLTFVSTFNNFVTARRRILSIIFYTFN